jgi:septal ring factor EnvC (AmiA/AmiB activator)
MADVGVVLDCATGQETVAPLTDGEQALRQRQATVAVADQAARDAADAARKAAVKQLKAQARAGGKVDASILAQLLGVDPNAPDPAQPAG